MKNIRVNLFGAVLFALGITIASCHDNGMKQLQYNTPSNAPANTVNSADTAGRGTAMHGSDSIRNDSIRRARRNDSIK